MSTNLIKVKRALISLSDKNNIEILINIIKKYDIEVLSTGGTAQLIREHNIAVSDVSDYTNFPEMLDGRVKTLHPKIHGGILGRTNLIKHKKVLIDITGRKNTNTSNKIMSIISEIFNGMRVVIANSKQEKMISLHKQAFSQHVKATIKSQILSQSIQSIYYPIGISAAICSMGISIYLGVKLSDTAIVLWSLFRAMPLLGNLISTNISISNFIPSYEQLETLKNKANQASLKNGNIKLINFKDKII